MSMKTIRRSRRVWISSLRMMFTSDRIFTSSSQTPTKTQHRKRDHGDGEPGKCEDSPRELLEAVALEQDGAQRRDVVTRGHASRDPAQYPGHVLDGIQKAAQQHR